MEKTSKKITNNQIVLEYIMKLTESTGSFYVGNLGIASNTSLTISQVSRTVSNLSALGLITKSNKARLTERGFCGTTRTITINLDEVNKYLNK
jgi:predicted transcriptional regulator